MTVFSPEFVRAVVGRGFDRLPRSHRNRIELDSLNMKDGLYCILGQLYGTYGHGVEAIFNVSFDTTEADVLAQEHGFYVIQVGNWHTNYALIQTEWVRRLELEREITELLEPVGSF